MEKRILEINRRLDDLDQGYKKYVDEWSKLKEEKIGLEAKLVLRGIVNE